MRSACRGPWNHTSPAIRIERLLFLTLLAAATAFHHPVEYDNTSSRYYLVSAAVDQHTLKIDSYHAWTIDKSFWNGHYYSNKAIGAPLLGAPVYWVLRNWTPLAHAEPVSPLARYLIRVMTTSLPFAILGVILFRAAVRRGATTERGVLMVLAYGLGTPALLHASQFSGHQITASFAFFAFALILAHRPAAGDGRPVPLLPLFVAGLFAGLASITDFPALMIAGVLALYVAFSRISWPARLAFVTGGVLCGLLLALYNYHCFGSPLNMAYSNLALKEFNQEAASGLFGVHLPGLSVLGRLLFSPARGLLFISPVLLLAGNGLWRMLRDPAHRAAAVTIGAILTLYLFFFAGYVGWHGGWAFGPRYLVPMLPFVAFPVAFAHFKTVTWLALLLVSGIQVWLALMGTPYVPEFIVNPLTDIIIPCIAAGYTSVNPGSLIGVPGLPGALPVVIIVTLLAGATLRQARRDQGAERPQEEPAGFRIVWLASLVAVLIMLATLHTSPEKRVHQAMYRLLDDAAVVTQSQALGAAAQKYRLLAEAPDGTAR